MLEINICIGTSCHINGAYNVVQTFQQLLEEKSLHDRVEFKACFCRRECNGNGVSVSIGDKSFRIAPEEAGEFFEHEVMNRLVSI